MQPMSVVGFNENWQYFVYNNELFGCDYREVDNDLFQQVVLRKSADPGWQTVFYSLPALDEFVTGELYEPHPTIPDNWKLCGRSDDIIVFSNGEKLNPVTMETDIAQHPDIRKALVVGDGRFQAGLILEPVTYPADEADKKYLIDNICSQQKPFLYSGMGELRKGATLRLYKDDIEKLYQESNSSEVVHIDIQSSEALMGSVRAMFVDELDISELGDDDDFTASGMDSLQVINACKLISTGLLAARVPDLKATVEPRMLYQNNTLRKLSSHIFSCLQGNENNTDAAPNHTFEVMRELIERYTESLPLPRRGKTAAQSKQQTVLLTGSTGSLGSYLLHLLERSEVVSSIICLNRGEDGGVQKQRNINAKRGLCTSFQKAIFLQSDLSQPHLSLSSEKYRQILDSVDCIIHNAWPVNFNFAIESFEPFIRGVRHLVDLAATAAKSTPVVFISSVGTVDRWPRNDAVPELSLANLAYASGGYGRSKLVTSLILDRATAVSYIPTAKIRVGQIAGPRGNSGMWNKKEWLPSIIASSVTLAVLPTDLAGLNKVAWLPVEDMAAAILDISGCSSAQNNNAITGYYNLVNPSVLTWQALVPTIQRYYRDRGRTLNPLSFRDWIDVVETSAVEQSRNPASKLLDTYKGLVEATDSGKAHPGYATARTRAASQLVRDLGPITGDLMVHWCQQWGFEIDS
ncbi:hypothetical protein NLG97_g8441 [Lecanicillium saksenae]|uniref:Uncharacterized protein n=1 Tax=Lecanicillium saksenae TaxID=468837 RepID=A0ACC1QJG9_9HYPO|nr:hypothetical protein NLG97_g8441 [Lecanicillium saksenae]